MSLNKKNKCFDGELEIKVVVRNDGNDCWEHQAKSQSQTSHLLAIIDEKKHKSQCYCASKRPRGASQTFISKLETSHKQCRHFSNAANGFNSTSGRHRSRVCQAGKERLRHPKESVGSKTAGHTFCVASPRGGTQLWTEVSFCIVDIDACCCNENNRRKLLLFQSKPLRCFLEVVNLV